MSHHLDSPASRQDPRLNLTDMYVFDGQTGTVLVMVVNTSLAGAARTPGFHPGGRYELKVHRGNESYENLTYRFVFGGIEDNGTQRVTLYRLTGADAHDDGAAGTLIAEGRTGEAFAGQNGARAWAGAAADPFYLDLRQLTHIIEGLQNKRPIDLGEWTESTASSSFTGSQICAIVLEMPRADELLSPGLDIAVWGTTKLATDAGGWQQINRAAIPMMWPLFRALGDADDSAEYARDTAAHPVDDRANDEARVSGMIAAATRITGAANPEAYGRAVARRLLPDLLPYTVGTPAAFSFAGFNGRTLADNAPEVMYALVTNTGFPTGLRSSTSKETRQGEFPYVVASKQSA
jgi:hypothetical protein